MIIVQKCWNNGAIKIFKWFLENSWNVFNCEINLILTWSDKCVLSNDRKATTFAKTDTKLYVPVVTLSAQDNAKLLEQLKSGFKRTINWNKYQRKVSPERQNQYLDFSIVPSFPGVNRLFVLSFEHEKDRTVHTNIIF